MTIESSSSVTYDRKNPFLAKVTESYCLNQEGSAKDTRHLVIDLASSGLTYEVGASLGIYPQNPSHIVAELLRLLNLQPEQTLTHPKEGEQSLHTFLTYKVALNRATKKFLQILLTKLPSSEAKKELEALLDHPEKLENYLWDRDFIDVLHQFPGSTWEPVELDSLFPKANPRLYSIASSPQEFPHEVHLTVAIIQYTTHNRKKLGLASGWLGHHVQPHITEVPVYVQPSKHFHLPSSGDTPIIMVGPGTGIAPFRAFLQERRSLQHHGRNWLFFGDQHEATDYLYQEDFKQFQQEGYLEKIHTAFSRDQEQKIYVQDRMKENAKDLWAWLQEGAYFYVCGDAKRMAKDVHQTLIEIVASEGNLPLDEARDWVEKKFAREEKRYLKDVY